ncbi:MAG: RDD family protein [Termitinemataceae bacterium]|nr:MAG: RDD family protein [Termitinemataceae bacterium]
MSDTTVSAWTAEGIAYNIDCAGLFVRGCAYAIDTLIQKTIGVIGFFVYDALRANGGQWMLLLIFFVTDWFYHVAWEIAGGGQSPGKRLMGIRVVMQDGTPITMSASLLRNLLRFADVFLNVLYLAAVLCISCSSGFRRIGDWTSGTLVVWTSAARITRKNSNYTLPHDIVPIVPKKQFTFAEKETVLMFARRYFILGKARADEIAAAWVSKYCGTDDVKNISPSDYILGVALFFRGEKHTAVQMQEAAQ